MGEGIAMMQSPPLPILGSPIMHGCIFLVWSYRVLFGSAWFFMVLSSSVWLLYGLAWFLVWCLMVNMVLYEHVWQLSPPPHSGGTHGGILVKMVGQHKNIDNHSTHLWETSLHKQTPGYKNKYCVSQSAKVRSFHIQSKIRNFLVSENWTSRPRPRLKMSESQ